ncbi:MAG TPA: hypothetical protein VIJ93_08745, partial [bacterium]
MKWFFPVLGLILLALLPVACGNNNAAPTAPAAPVVINHNYPLSSVFGSFGSGNGQFDSCSGVAVFRGGIFVADFSNNRIEKFDLNGNFLAAYTGFTQPFAIAFDSNGILYVVNAGAVTMIQPMDQNGNLFTPWGTAGTAVGQFTTPRGIALDSSNRVYVADKGNNRIQRCSNTGTGCVAVGGTATGTANGQFDTPNGVSVDRNGNVWVADSNNNRIQEFNSALAFTQSWGVYGAANGNLSFPTDARMDQDGNLIVVDQLNPGLPASVTQLKKFTAT